VKHLLVKKEFEQAFSFLAIQVATFPEDLKLTQLSILARHAYNFVTSGTSTLYVL
jgi:hypothetical protein